MYLIVLCALWIYGLLCYLSVQWMNYLWTRPFWVVYSSGEGKWMKLDTYKPNWLTFIVPILTPLMLHVSIVLLDRKDKRYVKGEPVYDIRAFLEEQNAELISWMENELSSKLKSMN